MIARLLLSVLLVSAVPVVHAQEPDGEETLEARITAVNDIPCDDGSDGCRQWSLTGLTGSMDGAQFSIVTDADDGIGVTTPDFRTGDRVIVQSQLANGQRQFILSDIVRRTPLLWLCVLFVAAVWIFGGLKTMRSFAGMLASLAVIFLFILPQILHGRPPVFIALIGSFVIMALTFLLGHGWNRKTLAAFVGTCGSLLLTAVLAWGFAVYAHLTGLADEEISYLLNDYPGLHTQGILLAAIIIGTLGVLDDITIAQSSAVYELRGANPRWTAAHLYRSAHRIGTDHISAAINTLILAYAGTALPLLLLLAGVPSGESWWIFLNREPIATEIVRTLVGSIGLLAAVPLTTWIAALWAVRTEPRLIPPETGHRH
jgi:uncharacterized membrane protein